MVAIPVTGTIFIIVMILGGAIYLFEFATKASRAAKRASERRARENAPRRNDSAR